jgi:hypothetical protein
MRRTISARSSPALIVAVVALVAALAGTAVAGPGASSSAITKAKVKKVANKQINKQLPWETGDIADAAITAAKLAPASVTAPKLATINTRDETVAFPANNFAEATADCQTGERVLSGGIRSTSTFPLVSELHKTNGEGWRGRAFNATGTAFTLTVEAYCLAA